MCLCAAVAAKLLRLSPFHHYIQNDIWGAMSERLTELSVNLTPHRDKPMQISVLTQLTNLVSLQICIVSNRLDDEVTASYALSHSGLKRLHVRGIKAKNLSLLCPSLRSLVMDHVYVEGTLSLPASLEDFAIRGTSGPPFKEPFPGLFEQRTFPVSQLLGLTSFLCHVPYSIDQATLDAALPKMLALRKLDIISFFGKLPPRLPSGLRAIRYFLINDNPLSSKELKHFAKACQLPELQSIGLYNCKAWTPSEIVGLDKIQQESKVTITMKEHYLDEDKVALGSSPG